jgi:hypothetical protein
MSFKNLDLFDLDTKLMTSVGPVYKQQETSSRYCVANDNLCNLCRYCKLLMLQQCLPWQHKPHPYMNIGRPPFWGPYRRHQVHTEDSS